MTKEELDFLIQQGEGYNLEFKESYNQSMAREICAMANASGGKILIGVTDDGKVKLVELNNKIKSEIQDLVRNFDPDFAVLVSELSGVIIVDVPEGDKKPYSTNGKFYMRQGANSQQLSRDEIKNFFINEKLIHFDETPNRNFIFEKDFNEDAYDNFLLKMGVETRLGREDILKNLELLSGETIKNAGALLFCKKTTSIFRSATIICALFMGKTKTKVIDTKEFDADLLSNYTGAFDYLRSKLNTEYIMTGGPREEILELPEKALREALLNAIAHRDYFSNANIQISIFSDRVAIDNPGGLMGKMKVEDLYKKSYPRNNLLFGLMQRMELVEKIGSGLMRINKMMDKYLLPHPVIEATDVYFGISFERPNLQKMSVEQRMKEYDKLGEKLGEKLGDKLGENQGKIIEIMRNNRNVTIPELSLNLDISTTAVENNLAKLKEAGFIRRIGPDKGGYWEVTK
jgi:ATP-dependent DNA helicase RecG